MYNYCVGTGPWGRVFPLDAQGAARGRALFFWAGAAVSAAPLLVVSPIGARCLYASYVFLLIVAGNLLSVLAPVATVRQAIAAAALTALTLGFYAGVYLPLYATENEQKARIVREMSAGNTEIVLPAYEDKGYLWDAASTKIGFFYYYEVPGDIMFRFVPAAELTD